MSASAVASAATPDVTAPIKAGKRRKLIFVGVAVLLVVALVGAGAALWLKSRAAAHAAEDAGDEEVVAQLKAAKPDPAHPPTFLPLDIFVVNLADRDADRYAQIGLTLEVDDPKFAEQMKTYMPAIRNAILMILAHKTSRELLERSGKEQLAEEILRETVRPLGITIAAPRKAAPAPVDGSLAEVPSKKAKAAAQGPHNPVRNVHFSNFIIQ
jgi:flagellar FliL protein